MELARKEREIEEEYLSSLMDLNVNSKPLINMLTMLAEDNIEHANVIVRVVDRHLAKVAPDVKLPILYLVDSIVKNLGEKYKTEFSKTIVHMFCGVFEKVNEKVREKLFNLRQTWNEVFPQTKLYALDVKVNAMDTNWPITAKLGVPNVHLNPNFLKNQQPPPEAQRAQEDILEQMRAKERELLELKQRKIELELLATKKKLMETNPITSMMPPRPTIPLPANPMADLPILPPPTHGRQRIAPVSSSMIRSARTIRDPRLAKSRDEQPQQTQTHQQIILGGSSTKSLPRIPKLSQSKSSKDDRERDPRLRSQDSKSSSRDSKSSRDKSKSSSKSSSSSRSSDRKKDDRKSSHKSSSSSHKSSSRSPRSKSPTRSTSEAKEFNTMKPDSTTGVNKDKLLNDLLNGEDVKSNQDLMSTVENDVLTENHEQSKDVDLRQISTGKKRSLGDETETAEPLNKKNKAEDLLFGNKDVDLRSLVDPETDKKSKQQKSDFEAVRAKLNARNHKNVGGVKFIDEFPNMPNSERDNPAEHIKKILGRKDTTTTSANVNSIKETPTELKEEAAIQPPAKQPRIAPVESNNFAEEKSDLTMTAGELRKTLEVPGLMRKEKTRRGTKWGEPTVQPQWQNRPQINVLPPVHQMNLGHFNNPWDNNPFVVAMRAQSQMPLVVPQSPSHPILNTKLRTLRLDGTKDHLLRFYNETAIIFNEHGEPRDIRFSAGQCRVIIDDKYSIEMFFNDDYKALFIDNARYSVKFGTPTRELYIDNNFYECYFNNQTTQIVLNDQIRMVRIEGKAPEVKIGVKRNDLVLGMINIVIDAEMMIPIFLDTTVQYFEYKSKIYTLQFADFFLSVIINNEPFKVEFGGLPRNYTLNGQKHFIRFTGLPDNITPGRVNLVGMKRTHLFRNCRSPPVIELIEPIENNSIDINKMVENDMRMDIQQPANAGLPNSNEAPRVDINDLLKKLVATGIIGAGNPSTSSNTANANEQPNVDDKSQENSNEAKKITEQKLSYSPVILTKPETIKKRQQGIVDTLYSGIQCSSCGLRFPPEQTMKYSQHLDWHFRQNRRERDSKRKAHFRKWYYNQSDWIKYEEIEDADEREKNFFETQQLELMTDQNDDGNSKGAGNSGIDNLASVSCPADAEDVHRVCDMCHDEFEQFFNEDTEEWHLRNAIKVDDKCYHPICYEDYKASLTLDETALMAESSETLKPEDSEMDVEIQVKEEKMEESEGQQQQGNENDDDDVMILPTEDPVITEILDETEVLESGEKSEPNLNATDDDVMIQEPKIETQLVPDDDDDEEMTGETSAMPMIVKIKEEPKDDGYEDIVNEEDPFVEVTSIAGDDLGDEAFTNSPFRPELSDENAVFDNASLLMSSPVGDDDNNSLDDETNSRADTNSNGAPALVGGNKKLKIVLSSLVQNNITNKNLINNVNESNEKVDNESVNKLDLQSVDLQSEVQKDQQQASNDGQDEPTIEFKVKPQLQGIKFEKVKKPVFRGIDNSGLCSIM